MPVPTIWPGSGRAALLTDADADRTAATAATGGEEEDGPATFAKEPALSPCAQGQANQLARALDRPGGLAPDPDRSAVKARKAMPSCDTSPKRHGNNAPLPIVHSVGA
jgi:hypothetical protein